MKPFLLTLVLILAGGARAQGSDNDKYVVCEYGLSGGSHQSFVEDKTDVDRWMRLLADPSSNKGFDYHPQCHPADQRPIYHLLSVSYGGVVSLIKGLRQSECEEMAYKLLPHCPDGQSCGYSTSNGMIKTAECFE